MLKQRMVSGILFPKLSGIKGPYFCLSLWGEGVLKWFKKKRGCCHLPVYPGDSKAFAACVLLLYPVDVTWAQASLGDLLSGLFGLSGVRAATWISGADREATAPRPTDAGENLARLDLGVYWKRTESIFFFFFSSKQIIILVLGFSLILFELIFDLLWGKV